MQMLLRIGGKIVDNLLFLLVGVLGAIVLMDKLPKKKTPIEPISEEKQRQIDEFAKHFDGLMSYDATQAYKGGSK